MLTADETERFDDLCRQHQPGLLGEALRLTNRRDDALDLLQDTYERALRHFRSFRPGTNGFGWLRTIMGRLFVDGWRRPGRRAHYTRIDDVDLAAPPADEPPLWLTVSGEELREAMRALPAQSRGLLEGQLDRQSYTSLAGRFSLKVPTVGSWLFRSRDRLRRVILDRRARAADA